MSSHQFALYAEPGQYTVLGRLCSIEDPQLRFRLVNILRVRPGSVVVLFTSTQVLTVCIDSIDKQHIAATVLTSTTPEVLSQKLEVILPLLEKEALEIALEHSTLHQAHTIHLAITAQSRKELRAGEADRYMRMVHAAQEQAKQFVAPIIKAPRPLDAIVKELDAASVRLVGSVTGRSIHGMSSEIAGARTVVVTVGPEGDFLPAEYTLLQEQGFVPLTLGRFVLRSCHAVALMNGLVRTLQCI